MKGVKGRVRDGGGVKERIGCLEGTSMYFVLRQRTTCPLTNFGEAYMIRMSPFGLDKVANTLPNNHSTGVMNALLHEYHRVSALPKQSVETCSPHRKPQVDYHLPPSHIFSNPDS